MGGQDNSIARRPEAALEVSGAGAGDVARQVAEAQAAIQVAKMFPRDLDQAFADIKTACSRPRLAAAAHYSYPRGGQVVTGPSIRLLEVVGNAYGNMQWGVRDLGTDGNSTVVQSYAWDVQKNVRVEKTFTVPHWRDTKSGGYAITGQRDVYELISNMGARRLRACLEQAIPRDILEEASEACYATLEAGAKAGKPIGDQRRELLAAFVKYGVKKAAIEDWLGHKFDDITFRQIAELRTIYKMIRDDPDSVRSFFGAETVTDPDDDAFAKEDKPPKKKRASSKRAGPKTPTDTE